MQGKWNTYKNFGWALAIGVAWLRYRREREEGTRR